MELSKLWGGRAIPQRKSRKQFSRVQVENCRELLLVHLLEQAANLLHGSDVCLVYVTEPTLELRSRNLRAGDRAVRLAGDQLAASL